MTPEEFEQLLRELAAPAVDYVTRAALTYPDNPERQHLLDRLNARWAKP